MYLFFQYLRRSWQEIVVLGIWLPVVTAAVFSGSIAVIVVSILGGLVSIPLLYFLIAQFNRLKRKQPTFGGEASTVPRKGLIFTVGLQTDTAAYCLEYQKPNFVGFLCSEQTMRTAKTLLASHSFSEDSCHQEIVDPHDVADVRAKTLFTIDWMLRKGLGTEDIAMDPTGGLTSMSLGALSAAQERAIDCQYLMSKYNEHNRPIRGTQRLVFISRYAEHPVTKQS